MAEKKRKKSRSRDELRHLLFVFFAVIFTVELILLAIAFGHRSMQSDLHADERLLLSAREMAHKARVKSNDLQLLAADVLQGGDRSALREYDRRARPEPTDPDYPNSETLVKLREGLRKLQTRAAAFVGDEVVKFENALAEAAKQRQTETKALNALRGLFQDSKGEYTIEAEPDPKLAEQLLADPEYKKIARSVQTDFSNFLSALDVRLFAVHKESSKNFRINFVIVLIAALAIATPVFYVLLLRSLNTSIRGLKITARKLTDELGQVNTELKAAITSREDYRRRLEQAEAASNRIIPSPQQDSRLHDVQEPELQDYLTRLP
jgi:methyl-accepting chemotaxis protein